MKGSESSEGWFTEAIIEHHADETKLYIAGEVVGTIVGSFILVLE
jgi:hypothetical protein